MMEKTEPGSNEVVVQTIPYRCTPDASFVHLHVSGLMWLTPFDWNSYKSQLYFVAILESSLLLCQKLPCDAANHFTQTLQSDKPVEPVTVCCPLTAPASVALSPALDPPAEGKTGDDGEKNAEESRCSCFRREESIVLDSSRTFMSAEDD